MGTILRVALTVLLGGTWAGPLLAAVAPARADRCAALEVLMAHAWPDPTTRVVASGWVPAGPLAVPASPGSPAASLDVPAHCELVAAIQERVGDGGQHYAIHFHLRLPGSWNGRFYFQGGGGSNGVLGDALGVYSMAVPPALLQGFAVVSQDSGHDNTVNNDPARGGALVFGFDAKARANYGHASLKLVADAAKAVVRRFYGKAPRYSYFVGCSKGGEEGLAMAERYGTEFDGIAAGAPGLSLPRAALAEAWDTQAIAALVKAPDQPSVPLQALAAAFTSQDLLLAKQAVLNACDADDGAVDGIVADQAVCTTAKVQPQLDALQCRDAKSASCLTAVQIAALLKIMGGARDGAGRSLYSDWPWDTGIAAPGWRLWKLGAADGHPPSLNVVLGGASLASDFTTPPTALPADPQALLDFQLRFDFDRDAPKIYATDALFPNSAWTDISARSPDLDAFRRHRGKLLVVHGVSDPVFSLHDTISWWQEVNDHSGGAAPAFVRLFAVPGMTHCGGGDATDRYDVLSPLVAWVERQQAPDAINATAGPASPWPNRTRPLCPYPSIARYRGTGDIESAASFECRR